MEHFFLVLKKYLGFPSLWRFSEIGQLTFSLQASRHASKAKRAESRLPSLTQPPHIQTSRLMGVPKDPRPLRQDGLGDRGGSYKLAETETASRRETGRDLEKGKWAGLQGSRVQASAVTLDPGTGLAGGGPSPVLI